MKHAKITESSAAQDKSRPVMSTEAREMQLTNLAFDCVERRLRNNTASSAETTYFLKLATEKTKLERENLELNKQLLIAKTQAIQASADSKELYEKALDAFKRYSGHGDETQ